MSKRRTADQIHQLLKEADRDLAKGLTVSDVCRKFGIAPNTFYRWRQRHDPAQRDDARCVRELESEVERLKRLVAELMLDKQMLQDIAKKSGEPRPAARRGGLSGRALRRLAAPDLRRDGAVSLDPEIPPQAPGRRTGADPGDQAAGPAAPAVRLPPRPRAAGPSWLDGQPQTGATALERAGAAAAVAPEKTPGTRPQAGDKRQQLHAATGAVQERCVDV